MSSDEKSENLSNVRRSQSASSSTIPHSHSGNHDNQSHSQSVELAPSATSSGDGIGSNSNKNVRRFDDVDEVAESDYDNSQRSPWVSTKPIEVPSLYAGVKPLQLPTSGRYANVSEIPESEYGSSQVESTSGRATPIETGQANPAASPISIADDDSDDNDMQCICSNPEYRDRPMVGCDHCPKWFHAECVGFDMDYPDAPFLCDACEVTAHVGRLNDHVPQGDDSEDDFEPQDDVEAELDQDPESEPEPELESQEEAESSDEESQPVRKSRSNRGKGVVRATPAPEDDPAPDDDQADQAPVDDQVTSYGSSVLRRHLEQMDIEADPKMVNIQKWKKALGRAGGGPSLKRVVLPTRIAGRIHHVRTLLAEPAQSGRQYQVTKLRLGPEKPTKLWNFVIENGADPEEPPLHFASPPICPQFGFTKKSDATPVGETLCELLDRMPYPPHTMGFNTPGKMFIPSRLQTAVTVAVLAATHADEDWDKYNIKKKGLLNPSLLQQTSLVMASLILSKASSGSSQTRKILPNLLQHNNRHVSHSTS